MILKQVRQYRVEGRSFDGNYLDARIFAHQLSLERLEPVLIEEYVFDPAYGNWAPLYFITPAGAPVSPKIAIQKALLLTAAAV